ncbi:TRAP-type transport system [Paramagnetospirillum caucaseum]|uniref:TRAP-type transport system n=1 Tax=Paramagnetospirillum caucaseum TaxID=1244869 RepID=M3AGH7_9PROT|nr:TAXI family TRAP transporter solute-binding subunit [Paramagnetospirillum caucaseum]EME71664.1 TRAP-type transport system [Paramagnetospirillum caucaseum]
MRNRTKILLLALLTLALTALVVGAVGYWYYKPTTVTIAVGPEASPEHRFARKLAEVLTNNRASIRLQVLASDAAIHNLPRFAQHEADLVVVRTDERRIPPSARAIAILEEEVLLLITPPRSKFKSLADMERRRAVVVGRDGRNETFVRRLLEQYKHDPKLINLRTVPPSAALDQLLGPGGAADVVVVLEPLSRLSGADDFQDLAHRLKGFTVHAIRDAKALERKMPGLYAETLEAGLLVGSPRIPDEELETVALQRILVARAKMPEAQVVDLMRALFESGRQLAVEESFATRIEPPATEKGGLIAIHPGADQYVASDVKTFFDRYSDLLYVGLSAAGILGSGAAALYGTVFRRAPIHAGRRAQALMGLRDRARAGRDGTELDAVESELEAVLDEVLGGLADGSISPRGLDAFRLAYDSAREALTMARRGGGAPHPTT